MFKNYFKVAIRNLAKNKVSSFINIGGLAIGMAVTMLISLWIYDELSFNTYHKNYDSIGQVMTHNGTEADGTYSYLPAPLGKELRASFPNDFQHVVLASATEDHIIASADKKFTQAGNFMEPGAPEMLTLDMVNGTRAGLKEPNSILIAATLARKLFGNVDPVNKTVKIDNRLDVKVTGVYRDLPGNSVFKNVSFVAPFDLLVSSNDWVKKSQDDWTNNAFHVFVQLSPGNDFETVSARIRDIELKHINKERALSNPVFFVQPMSKWHLYSKFQNRVIVTSEALKYVWFYGIIGSFVLLLACINFMNLSTARSEKRAKEVGIRKAIGSMRAQLINQFFCESLLTVSIAFLFSIMIVWLILPWFNDVAGKTIVIPWTNTLFWFTGIGFTIITGLLAGSYPALYLSSLTPVKVLKGPFRAGPYAAVPRKVMVVFQFAVSISLIIGTMIVYREIQYARNRPVGYSRHGLLQIQMTSPDFQGKYEILSSELKNTGAVTQMAESSGPVTGSWSNSGGFDWKGRDSKQESDFALIHVSYEYGKTVGFQFVDGRDFSREYATDSSGLIINEAAAKYMGLRHPVGEIINWENSDIGYNSGANTNKSFKILGVVKDMIMNSPFEPVKQTVFCLGGDPGWISVRINPSMSITQALPKIESVFKKIIPSAPFDYSFVDEDYALKFSAEESVGKLASFFAILAILISCLGLFGLSVFVAEQRVKEIGVRKVLGASVFNLWSLLSEEFVILVFISLFIAVPATYYFMHNWIQNYQYREDISWWIFAIAAIGALGVTLLTVSFQAITTAIANPIKSLRTQ